MIRFLKNNGWPVFVGIREGGAFHWRLSQMVQLVDLLIDAKNQISETFPAAELSIQHGHHLGLISEFPGIGLLPGVRIDDMFENMSRYKL